MNEPTQTVLPPLAPVQRTTFDRVRLPLLTAIMAAPFALNGMASAAGDGLDFDVDSVKTSVMSILGVGVAISIAFAVYKVGKRGTNKI